MFTNDGFMPIGGGIEPWWGDLIGRGIDVAGAAFGRGNYYSPDDPRFQQQGNFYQRPIDQDAVSLRAAANRNAVGAGLNISSNTLLLVGLGVVLFMLGTKKGR